MTFFILEACDLSVIIYKKSEKPVNSIFPRDLSSHLAIAIEIALDILLYTFIVFIHKKHIEN